MDILIPAKGFRFGKSRLSAALDPSRRADLCRALFLRTLTLARQVSDRVCVVTGDAEVATIALSAGAVTIADPGLGLNSALAFASRRFDGDAALLILPTDLPRLTAAHLQRVAALDGVVLAADRHDEGTNLLALPASLRRDFAFAYGPGSCDSHRAEAQLRGAVPRILRDPAMTHDIDTPADLALWSDAAAFTNRGRDNAAA